MDMAAGGVAKLLEQTQKIMDEGKMHQMIISAKFHHFFIYLHPFADGNGRLGRLLSKNFYMNFEEEEEQDKKIR